VFFCLKLLKTALRNSLKENTLESLILIHDESKGGKPITVLDQLIEKYDLRKRKSNQDKSVSRIFLHNNSKDPKISETDPTEIKDDIIREEESKNEILKENITENEDINDISDLLEKSCVMENEGDKKEKNQVKERQAKKTLYSAMLKSLDAPLPPLTGAKLKKIKLEK